MIFFVPFFDSSIITLPQTALVPDHNTTLTEEVAFQPAVMFAAVQTASVSQFPIYVLIRKQQENIELFLALGNSSLP